MISDEIGKLKADLLFSRRVMKCFLAWHVFWVFVAPYTLGIQTAVNIGDGGMLLGVIIVSCLAISILFSNKMIGVAGAFLYACLMMYGVMKIDVLAIKALWGGFATMGVALSAILWRVK